MTALLNRQDPEGIVKAAARLSLVPPRELTRLLHKLAVRPFTDESVNEYKEAFAREANKYLWWHRFLEGLVNALAVTLFSSFTGFLLALVLAIFYETGVIGLAFVAVSATSFLILLALEGVTVKERGAWHVQPLENYLGYVPEIAREQARQIKKALPETRFYVHFFIQSQRTLDPFLSVVVSDESYFTFQWDEPDFRG